MSIQDLLDAIAQGFFQGDTTIAGIVLFTFVIGFVFLIFAQRNVTIGFVLALPVTLVFSVLGVLPEILTVLIVILLVLGITYKFRDTMS